MTGFNPYDSLIDLTLPPGSQAEEEELEYTEEVEPFLAIEARDPEEMYEEE